MNTRFEAPTIKARGQLARAMDAVQQQRSDDRDVSGSVNCTRCPGKISFTVLTNGASVGRCMGGCGISWREGR